MAPDCGAGIRQQLLLLQLQRERVCTLGNFPAIRAVPRDSGQSKLTRGGFCLGRWALNDEALYQSSNHTTVLAKKIAVSSQRARQLGARSARLGMKAQIGG